MPVRDSMKPTLMVEPPLDPLQAVAASAIAARTGAIRRTGGLLRRGMVPAKLG